ncbi:Transmembrane 7 superfamily member 3 [Frankliniella fusca]|uniref:Transmembrane 7 superfamily member 3 n=1 Tax=Frankliniella fusca TaxID=407009 RepID=A0AAE1HJI8_9NEOP|nr:Transmembrane 7 superfamily member 3 [Frankliniella fusca]
MVKSKGQGKRKRELYCVCEKPAGGRFMICCDQCDNWFHGDCVGIMESQKHLLKKVQWHCHLCKLDVQKQLGNCMARNLKLEEENWQLLNTQLKYHQERSEFLEKMLKSMQDCFEIFKKTDNRQVHNHSQSALESTHKIQNDLEGSLEQRTINITENSVNNCSSMVASEDISSTFPKGNVSDNVEELSIQPTALGTITPDESGFSLSCPLPVKSNGMYKHKRGRLSLKFKNKPISSSPKCVDIDDDFKPKSGKKLTNHMIFYFHSERVIKVCTSDDVEEYVKKGMLWPGALGKCHSTGYVYLCLAVILLGSENITVRGDSAPQAFSLDFYNPLNQSTWSINTLEPSSTTAISVDPAPSDVRFYVFQVHAHLHNISLSYNSTLIPHQHVNGTNTGLVWMSNKGRGVFYVMNPNPENVTVMYAIVAYGAYSPIPGGCNMEFEVETAPYLKVSYSDAMVEVTAQPSVLPGRACALDMVSHDVYRMYMDEKDFSAEAYFAAIQSMLSPNDILNNGSLSPLPIHGSIMRRLYSLYAGTGSVYVVLAHSLSGSAAYVPAVTYGCSAIYFTDSCSVLTTTFSKVLCATVLFLGLFACFYGHEFFRTQLFLSGFMSGSLLAYIGLVQLTILPFGSSVTLSCIVGIGAGAAYMFFWWMYGIPVVAILLMVTPLGFLAASLAFFVGLGDMQFAQMDLDFWLTFVLVLVSVLGLTLPLEHNACIVSCAVVGAYAFVVPIDHYAGSGLKYIVINTLRRASVPGFSLAVIQPPFQGLDGALVMLWCLFAVIGVRVQQIRLRGRSPFPPSSRSPPPLTLPRPRGGLVPSARTPLRVSSRIPYSYGSVGDDDVFETPPPPPGSAPPEASLRRSVSDWFGSRLRGR